MYSMENYLWGIIGYLVGAGFVIWYLVWLLGHISSKTLRHVLLMVCVAILLTPIQAYTDQPFWAPAFVVMAFEGLLDNGSGEWQRSLTPIIFVFSVMLLGYGLYQWWRHRHSAPVIEEESGAAGS